MIIENYWHNVVSAIKEDQKNNVIYIIGDPDTGKTTFSAYLIHSLIPEFSVGYLDCDPGQTSIGPPSTLGLGIFYKGKSNVSIKNPDVMYLRFVGSTSPSGHLLESVSGIKRLAEKAAELKLDKLIVESSGFVQGHIAEAFQYYSIDLLNPDYIIELYHNYSLKSLLLNFQGSTDIIRMKSTSSIKQKTPLQRRQYREKELKHYFSIARKIILPYDHLGLHGRIPSFHQPHDVNNVLIALCNRNQFVISLGIIKEIAGEKKEMTIMSPPFPEEKTASIHFGSIRCDESGIHG